MARIFLRSLVVGCALAVVAVGSALADPPLTPPPAAAAADRWAGWYAGVNAGYSWGSTGIKYVVGPNAGSFGDPPFGAGGSLKTSASPASAIGGLQLGYNFFQMQQWVVGVVTDVDARNGSDQRQIVLNSLGGGVGDRVSYTDRQKWLGTTRINLGFAPMNDWLLSAGAGIAYGQVNHTASQLDALGGGGFAVNSLSDSTTRIG
jgi:outer membrane immunogenic protein